MGTRLTSFAASLVLPVLLISCTAVDTSGAWSGALDADQRAELARVREAIVRLAFPGENLAGTAIRIGGDRLLTCRHCVATHLLSYGIPEPGPGEDRTTVFRPAALADVSGETAMVRLAEVGPSSSLADDWAILEIVRPAAATAAHAGDQERELVLDPHRSMDPGEEILLIGFPEGTTRWPELGGPFVPSTVRSRVIAPPFFLFVPAEILCIDAPTDEVIHGMSGGAAVVWDPVLRRAVIVGIYRGMRQLEGFGHVWGGVQTVRRVPHAATWN